VALGPGVLDRAEAPRERGPILQRLERRLREWVGVRDVPRARHDLEGLWRHRESAMLAELAPSLLWKRADASYFDTHAVPPPAAQELPDVNPRWADHDLYKLATSRRITPRNSGASVAST